MSSSSQCFRMIPLLLLATLLGCGGGGGTPTTPPGLPDPGLTQVATDNGRARGAAISPEGGSITATGSNGATYKLTIPAGALPETRTIGVYPVTSIATLPAGAPVVAGVYFTPAGLTFDVAASLEITLPSSIPAADLLGLAFEGDGQQLRTDFAFRDGNTLTLPVQHFSGKALAGRAIEDLLPELGSSASRTRDEIIDRMTRNRERQTGQELIDRLTTLLRNWYTLVLVPAFDQIPQTSGVPTAPYEAVITHIITKAGPEYDAWLDALLWASQVTGQPAASFVPEEQAQGEERAAQMLRVLYLASMEICKEDAQAKPNTPASQVGIAARALALVEGMATLWDLPRTEANRLDEIALREDSCVRCELISPSINRPEQDVTNAGKFTTKLGVRITGGSVRHDLPMRLRVVEEHTLKILADRRNPGAALQTVSFTWPKSVATYRLQVFGVIEIPNLPAQISTGLEIFELSTCDSIIIEQVYFPTPAYKGGTYIANVDTIGRVNKWLWEFGGGATSPDPTAAAPEVKISGDPGTYTGRVTVTDTATDCEVSKTFQYSVELPPPLPYTSKVYVGTITEINQPPFPINCEKTATARFRFGGTTSGLPEFVITYSEPCEPHRAIGDSKIFTVNQSDIQESSFVTRSGGTGLVSGNTLTFQFTGTGGTETITFVGEEQT